MNKFTSINNKFYSLGSITALLFIYCICIKLSAATQENYDKTHTYFRAVKTKHSITVNKEKISYSAIAGQLPIYKNIDNSNINICKMSYIAYFKTNTNSRRPVTFLFAGGPGASTAVVNFFESGPKYISMSPIAGTVSNKKSELVDNPLTWLQFTDLVYIDAPGTGFGVIEDKKYSTYLWGCMADADCFAQFINTFIKKYSLKSRPFFISGESYGGMRAVLLADKLIKYYSKTPAGLLLFSPMLDYSYDMDNSDPTMTMIYALSLPSMTAAAYYHKKLSKELLIQPMHKVINASAEWAMSSYLSALNNLESLNSKYSDEILPNLIKFTGLDKDTIEHYNYKVPVNIFLQQLLVNEKQYMGMYDSRYTLNYPENGNIADAADPFWAEEGQRSSKALKKHYTNDLKINTNIDYIDVNTEAAEKWIWQSADEAMYSVQVVSLLNKLITKYPEINCFTASGYFDLCIPFKAQQFVVDHLQLPKELSKNIKQNFYYSGHELYTNKNARKNIFRDVKNFYTNKNLK